jgi:hypothetical protein
MFLVGGYKQEFWYWQAVIMVRKLLLGMVTVFIPKELPELQNYLAMWIMMLALSLQLWLKPNTENMHNNVETFSLAAVTLTLNFGLVYFWPEVASGWQDFVTVFLITVTFFCLVVFAFYLYEPLRDELAKVETAVADVIRTMLEDKPDDPDPKRKRALLRRRAPEQPQDGAPLETIGFRPPLRARSFVSTNDFDEVDDNEEEDDRAIHPVQRGDFDEYY